MSHLETLGPDATLLDVYRRYPPLARHMLGLAEEAFRMTETLTRAECELIGAHVSALNDCAYCRGIHVEVARVAGMEDEALDGIEDGRAPAYGGDRWLPIFAYAAALTTRPNTIGPAHIDALKRAGWSDDAIVQIAAVTVVFNSLNRLADGLGLAADDGFFKSAGERLATKGYGGTADMLGVR